MKKYLDRERRSVIISHNSFFIMNKSLTGGLAFSRVFASGDPAKEVRE
jgi:hypothetical protein